MMVVLIACGALAATLLGGFFALKFKDSLHLILGFSAGAVIGVAFFDLLPEALDLSGTSYGTSTMTGVVALGFILYLFLDRVVILHAHADEDGHGARGSLGAGSLSIHSFLDGAAIGLAFQVSVAVGAIVAAAVLVHDFSDGINTVNLVLKNGGSFKKALRWLIVDAIAPVVGIISTSFFTVSGRALGLLLATFCGFFLYIGASDLLPESHHRHATIGTTLMTALGIGVLYGAVTLAGL